MRYKIAYLCFGLSSIFRVLGKLIRSGPTIVVDSLSMPGWFIIDCYLIEQLPLGKGLKGFEWHTYPMPDDWMRQMEKMKNKHKEKR